MAVNDGMEWGSIAQWVAPLVSSAAALVIASRAAFSRKDEKAIGDLKEDIDELKGDIAGLRMDDARIFGRIDKVEQRVAKVETEIKHLPTRDDVHAIDVKLAEQGQMLRSLTDVCGSLAGSVKAIERSLIEREMRDAAR